MSEKIVNKDWLIYGVTGYTGRLIIEEAHKQGLSLMMAGRDVEALEQLKQQYGYDYVCFDLSSRQHIAELLAEVKVVLNCAGPFSQTAKPFMSACMHSNTHYLDITGEIEVFEHAKLLNNNASKAGVMICPGVGFDVVPTDCLAKGIAKKLPGIESLWLGFSSASRMSPGTAKTAVEGLAPGGKICRTGRVVDVPLAYKVRKIDFGNGLQQATTIPWGDVATASFGTDIPNVEVYIPMPDKMINKLKRLEKFRWLFKYNWVINWLKNKVDQKIIGPTEEQRSEQPTYIWGEGISRGGDVVSARIKTANGYDVTKYTAIAISQHVLKHEVPAGFTTPACLMGPEFIEQIPGSEKIEWQETRSQENDALE